MTGLGTGRWVSKLFQLLISNSAQALEKERVRLNLKCLTFTFDEASQLNFDHDPQPDKKPPDNRITLRAMQRVIKACDRFPFWFPMLDTGGLSDVFPDTDQKTALSWRLQGTLQPLPPWLYIPFDVMVSLDMEKLPKTPLEALTFTHLRVYGRPVCNPESFDEGVFVLI